MSSLTRVTFARFSDILNTLQDGPTSNVPIEFRKLAVALLESAYDDALLMTDSRKRQRPTTRRNLKLQKEAILWLFQSEDASMKAQKENPIERIGLTMIYVCRVLNWDIDAVQERIRRQYEEVKQELHWQEVRQQDQKQLQLQLRRFIHKETRHV